MSSFFLNFSSWARFFAFNSFRASTTAAFLLLPCFFIQVLNHRLTLWGAIILVLSKWNARMLVDMVRMIERIWFSTRITSAEMKGSLCVKSRMVATQSFILPKSLIVNKTNSFASVQYTVIAKFRMPTSIESILIWEQTCPFIPRWKGSPWGRVDTEKRTAAAYKHCSIVPLAVQPRPV